ncbi:MAG: tRNA lysidine(34) synthetase TilS [Candidatus Izimaplasma sp.]|nr:tRNA lysidine(34) synthetase TilS [Candidatus Izimaplasma bacterium]
MVDLITYVQKKAFITKNEPIIVSVSTGVDSMVLLHVCEQLTNSIIVAHINHNQRSASTKEYKFIKAYAKKKNYIFEGHTITKNITDNFQEQARRIRYKFLKGLASKHNIKKIFVGHHLDDQVETILMRLVRGSSFSGYSGIKEVNKERNITLIRPFLDIKKSVLKQYAKTHNIKYFIDQSNSDIKYTRNRFRHNIIPLLEQENPKFDEKIKQFSEYIGYADSLLETLKNNFIKSHCMYGTMNLTEFNKQNPLLKIKLIKHLVNKATDDTVEVSYEQYHAIIYMCLTDTPNQKITLENKYEFIKEYETIFVEKATDNDTINKKIIKAGTYYISNTHKFIISDKKITQNYSNYFELCYNKLVFPLFLRTRQNGDKMKLTIGTKKVKDVLIDQKIPPSKRDELVVLADEENVLWIPGIKKSTQDQSLQHKLYIYEVKTC